MVESDHESVGGCSSLTIGLKKARTFLLLLLPPVRVVFHHLVTNLSLHMLYIHSLCMMHNW